MNLFLLADAVSRVGQIAINCFAVAGAFLVGNYAMASVLKVAGKFYFRKKLPDWACGWSRFASGIICAILAALILFGDGGYGLGGSGGGRPGGPGNDQHSVEKEEPSKEPEKKAAQLPVVVPEEVKNENRVKIIVLGGARPDEAYYLIENSREPISFDKLKDLLITRRRDAEKQLQRIDILVYKDTAYRESYLVKQLESWAKDNGLSVNFPPVASDNMPER
ncbi:hypothetical protein KIH39_04025 [Telmatocola sphagniphila]|uniref:Uncharacterized protein n=1 Tax=Telmatocola sphagniphila TaxID=1123043 RepID=A0A8E6B837_9BACT|nr:hypothetical protein [Telmatocola sphagniphila]QVL33092.1 hypothetical protein KIH39_04025 [Telmatocola sphagniphila]